MYQESREYFEEVYRAVETQESSLVSKLLHRLAQELCPEAQLLIAGRVACAFTAGAGRGRALVFVREDSEDGLLMYEVWCYHPDMGETCQVNTLSMAIGLRGAIESIAHG